MVISEPQVIASTSTSTVSAFITNDVTIQVSAKTTLRNCPTFYYADDPNKAIYAYEVSGGFAHIRMPFGLANGEYTIYYKACDGSRVSTGKTVTVDVDTIDVTNLYLAPYYTKSLYRQSDKYINITFSELLPYSQFAYAVIARDDGKKFKFEDCSYSEVSGTLQCNNIGTPLIAGVFTLSEIAGDMRFNLDGGGQVQNNANALPQPYQIYSHSSIDSIELNVLEGTSSSSSFKIANYSNTNDNYLYDCTLSGLKVTCDSSQLSSSFEIPIFLALYYEVYETTATELIRIQPYVSNYIEIISVLSIQLVNPDVCDTVTTFTITTSGSSDSDSNISAKLYSFYDDKRIDFTCTQTTLSLITCTSASVLEKDTYRLVYLVGMNNKYDFMSIQSNEIVINPSPRLSAQTVTSYIITSDNPNIYIDIDSAFTDKIYMDEACTVEVPCEKKGTTLVCTPDISSITPGTTQKLYYKPCGRGVEIGVQFVTYSTDNLIEVSGITVSDNTQTASGESGFLIKTFTQPSGAISEVKLGNSSGSEVTINSCQVSLTIPYAIQCYPSPQLDIGEYTLKSVVGDKVYDLSKMTSNSISITAQIDYLGVQLVNYYPLGVGDAFPIKLIDNANTPNIFLGNLYLDDNKVTCQVEENSFNCYPNLNSYAVGDKFEIFYEASNGQLKSTTITIERVDRSDIIPVDSFFINNGQTGSTTPISSVTVLVLAQSPAESSGRITLTRESDGQLYESTTCTTETYAEDSNLSKLTCQVTINEDGKYYLSSLKGDYKYDVHLFTTPIQFATQANPIASQDNISITKDKTTFTIQLVTGLDSAPEIYLDNDSNKALTCHKNGDTLECDVDTALMDIDNTCQIYYSDLFGNLMNANLSVTRTKKTITINSIAITGTTKCQIAAFSSFIAITDSVITGPITGAVLTKEQVEGEDSVLTVTFSTCAPVQNENGDDTTTISCSTPSTDIVKGKYTLTAFNGEDIFVFTSLTDTLVYTSEILSSNQNTTQNVNKLSPSFEINLYSADTPKPDVYVKKGEDFTLLSCDKKAIEPSILECQREGLDDGDNSIYYTGPCSEKEDTLIKVTNAASIQLTVSTLTVKGGQSTSESEIKELSLTFTSAPKGLVNKIVLSKGQDTFEFTCGAATQTMTCTREEALPEGAYTLTAIEGYDDYTIPADLASIQYGKDTFTGVEQELEQKINKDKSTFVVNFSAETTTQPTIYTKVIENDVEVYKVVPCSRNIELPNVYQLVCTPTSTEMPESTDYEIFYESPFDGPVTTNIIVTNVIPQNLSATDISLSLRDPIVCSSSPFTQFVVSFNDSPNGISPKFTLTLQDGSGTSFTFESCGEYQARTRFSCLVTTHVPPGYYKLTSVTGEDNYDISPIADKTIQYDNFANVLGEQTAAQTINGDQSTFSIILTEEGTMPVVYTKVDDEKKGITCKANDGNAMKLDCELPAELMTNNGSYDIYVEGACKGELSTGITVSYVKPIDIQVTKVYIEKVDAKEKQCQSEPIKQFTFVMNKQPTVSISGAVITKKDDANTQYTFTSCTPSEESGVFYATCTYAEDIVDGEYTLTAVNSKDKYTIASSVSAITYEIDPLSPTQTITTPQIDKTTREFNVILKGDATPKPDIYVGNAADKKTLSCTKDGSTVVCKPTDNEMPDTDDYEIYYLGACGEVNPTGITVSYQLTTEITVGAVGLKDSSDVDYCSTSAIEEFTFSINKKPNGKIDYAILTNTEDDTNTVKFTVCTPNNDNTKVRCSTPEKALIGGSYTLTLVEGVDTFTLTSIADTELQYDDFVSPFADGQKTPQEVNGDDTTFTIALKSSGAILPKMFVGDGDDAKELDCTAEESTVTCTPTSENMPESTTYEIFYEGACKEKFTTGITISNVLPKNIKVISLSLVNKEQCAPNTPFSDFVFETDVKPTTKITDAVLIRNDDDTDAFTFSSCAQSVEEETNEETGEVVSTKYLVTCTTPDKEILPGSYTLQTVNGKDTYTVESTVSALSFETNPLGEQTELSFRINPDTPDFTITLISEETPAMPVYILVDEDYQEIPCDKNLTQLVCHPIEKMTETTEYKIYYRAECGEKRETGIICNNVLPISIPVNEITLADGYTCRSDAIASLTISIDIEPTGSIKEAILVDESANEFVLEKCENSGTTIVCTTETPIETDGVYKIKEIKGVDTYTLDIVKDAEFKLDLSTPYLGEQTATEQEVNSEEKTFTIVLASETVEPPKIYVGKDETNEVTCARTGTELVCTPDENNMSESMAYEIYYKDICGNLMTTGVTVNNVLPGQQGGEIVILTKGEYLKMWKLMLGALLLLML